MNLIIRFLALFALATLVPARVQADQWNIFPVATQLPGDSANAASSAVRLNSLDGRYALFESRATNLVAGQIDGNAAVDVFVRDTVSGTTTLISSALGDDVRTANAASFARGISADGRWILFVSDATDLIDGLTDANGGRDLFLLDRTNGVKVLVSHQADSLSVTANGAVQEASLSGDGRWVAYATGSTNLRSGFTGPPVDNVYLFDRTTRANTLVTHAAASATTGGDRFSDSVRISADGQWTVFASRATNLLAGDTNDANDVFLFDRVANNLRFVSHQSGSSTAPANSNSGAPSFTPDGRWVMFNSIATNLVSGVTDNASRSDVFVFDRTSGTNILASRPAGSTTTTPNQDSIGRAISDDGAYVAFESHATDLGATDPYPAFASAYLFNRTSGTTTLVSRERGTTSVTSAGSSTPIAISADGQSVAFVSSGDNLIDATDDLNGANDLFLFRIGVGITLVSRAGTSAYTAAGITNGASMANGRLAFQSEAHDLLDGRVDANGSRDVFLRDGASGERSLISVGNATPQTTLGKSANASGMSPDARWVVFATEDDSVVAGVKDFNQTSDVFLLDRQSGATTLVSTSAFALARSRTATGPAGSGVVSADGRFVLYMTRANDADPTGIDGNGLDDVYLFDRTIGRSRHVSRSPTTGAAGNRASTPTDLSADGRYALFDSAASNLVDGVSDSNNKSDVFVFDRDAGSLQLVSRTAAGNATLNGESHAAAMSPDGRWILFDWTRPSDFGIGSHIEVMLFDRESGATTRVSPAISPFAPTTIATGTAVSADGQWVLFGSTSPVVVAGGTDSNGAEDTFLFDRVGATITLVSHALGSPTTTANGASRPTGLSADGRWALFQSSAADIAGGVLDGNGAIEDVYVYDRLAGTSALVSRAQGTTGTTPNGVSGLSMISADGRWIAYATAATNVAGAVDVNGPVADTFVFDRIAGITSHVSRAFGSLNTANGESTPAAISADGRWLLMTTRATDLGYFDVNALNDSVVAEHRFDVNAIAGPNGAVSPAGVTTMPFGSTHSVALTPASDYSIQAVSGCGGSLANGIYTTAPVLADCTVTASFGNVPPTLGTTASLTVLEDSALRSVAVSVADVESAAAALTLTATSAQPAVLANPSVAAGASGGERLVQFAPIAQRNGGPVTITLTLTDVPGAIATGTFAVTITPVNDAPMLAFAPGPRHPQGTIGAQSLPAFASVDVGPDDEDAIQSVEDFQIVAIADPSGIIVPASLDIANNGTLSYALTGATGTATVQANVRDDSGTQNGGQSVSATQTFTVLVEGPLLFANGFE